MKVDHAFILYNFFSRLIRASLDRVQISNELIITKPLHRLKHPIKHFSVHLEITCPLHCIICPFFKFSLAYIEKVFWSLHLKIRSFISRNTWRSESSVLCDCILRDHFVSESFISKAISPDIGSFSYSYCGLYLHSIYVTEAWVDQLNIPSAYNWYLPFHIIYFFISVASICFYAFGELLNFYSLACNWY